MPALADPAFANSGRFFKGNIHTHSNHSDGARPAEAVCAAYRERGYDFLSLTDHFLAKYDFPVVDTQPFRTNSFTTILGAEVHAPKTSLGERWHVLAVGLPQNFPPTADDESGPALAARCIAAGAFVAIAHPTWYGLTLADAASIPGAHAVEIYNHTSQVRTDRGDSTHFVDQLLAEGRRATIIAVDDAHFHCDDAFGGFVMVKAEANEPDALLAALKAGAFYSSQGPSIHAVQFDGGFVEVSCSPARAIMALGRASKATQLVGHGLSSARLDLAGFAGGGYVRLVVVDELGRRAWTNPVWL
jgi:hypothetical protein